MVRRIACCCLMLFPITLSADEVDILLVGARPDHPYGTHMYAFECQLLKRCLDHQTGVRATYLAEWPPEDDVLAAAEAVVFYSSPAGSVLLAGHNSAPFDAAMRRGVGFVAIHWGTGVGYDKVSESQSQRDLFKSWLGGWFRRPPCDISIGQTLLKQVDPSHPIHRGWSGWKIRDEFYLRPVLHEKALPLLEVEIENERHVVGWTFERTPGRSVGITLGHFHDNFMRDDFRRLLVNSILWAAGIAVPDAGSRVDVTPEALVLPKEPPQTP